MEKVAIVYTVRTEKVAIFYTVRKQRWGGESSYSLHCSHTEIGMEKVAIVYTVRTQR